jgi:DNA-binding transcriptional ArsR family regulator
VIKHGDTLDRIFQALADPARRSIVERLTSRPFSVTELAQPLPMSMPAVFQHLQVLEGAGLVRSEKFGRVRTCHIDPGALGLAEAWLGARRTIWEDRLDRLGDILTQPDPIITEEQHDD